MNIGKMLELPQKYGDVFGVEFEFEFTDKLEEPPKVDGWKVIPDGSLRHGSEYVLKTPYTLQEAKNAIIKLKDALPKDCIDDNGYAGTHVHVNVSDLSFAQLFNFILVFLSMENILASRYYGEDRQGNLFCLRLQDAEYLGIKLLDVVMTGKLEHLNTDRLRYSSLNVLSLFKYGTLEFRGLRGDGDFDKTILWIDLLNRIKQFSKEIEDPIALLTIFSETQGDFVYNFIPDLTESEKYEVLLGIRRVQAIAYAGSDLW